ncbi:hypothetical protein LINPERPRIM_LOCUS14917 [Linum perenne]
MILSDSHIRYLFSTYSSREVDDIYVDHVIGKVDVNRGFTNGEPEEFDEDYIDNKLLSESEDSNFEVGSWISQEDREEVEEIRRKVRAAKENLKTCVPFSCNHNSDAYESDGFGSDEVGTMIRPILMMKFVERRVRIRSTIRTQPSHTLRLP